MTGQRLDKWLWCTRLAKTRSGAQRAIEAGKVRVNGSRALKASRLVHSGDVVTATLLGRLSVVCVLAASERRGPATVARTLYEDLTPKAPKTSARAGPTGGPRPTKRDRRHLDALRRSEV
jgi:ribosome-associated heat shock protein Hsp15